MSLNCVIIGAGNLATHLALQLKVEGYSIVQVYSRTEKSARELATKAETTFTTQPNDITQEGDIYFVALKDDAIQSVLSEINLREKLIVHTAGSVPLSILYEFSKNTGVLYPLQTFSKEKEVNFKDIPVFIEANTESNLSILNDVATKISDKVAVINSAQRMALHIAAVFACNFTNHFYCLANEILRDNDLDFELIKPLILETAKKIEVLHPFEAQTGPAIRNDQVTMEKHLEALSGNKKLAELYKTISKSIFKSQQK